MGKSTLVRAVYPEPALRIVLANVEDRQRYGGEGRLSYFRTKTGVEVELILEHRVDRSHTSGERHDRKKFLMGKIVARS